MQTGDNNRFLRLWFEVDFDNIGFGYKSSEETKNTNKKWFPHNKGGKFRKWYGNQEYIINWENNGFELKNYVKTNVSNIDLQFKESISWSRISNSNISFRYYPYGFLFDSAACSIFLNQNEDYKYLLGLLNSNVSQIILNILAPTLNYQAGDIALIPLLSNLNNDYVVNIVESCIGISYSDWNEYERSWDFKRHPFLKFNGDKIEDIFEKWDKYKCEQKLLLESNEIKLNKLYSDIYSINGEIDIDNKFISVDLADYKSDVRSFISYFIGCLFGRYSLDEEKIISAGTFNINQYHKYIPDEDNIVPILDNDYFEDDIVNRFEEFLKTCFGEEHPEENLEFIAKALKKKGNTPREIIRNYFLNDFFKDHTKTYQKRPIYWQFDSGKQNGFKCLIYMHRYTPDTLARIRTEYLHKTQKAYETQLEQQKNLLNNTSNSKDKARINKEIKKLTKQIQEIQKYDETLATLADQNIKIDLDDGVKVNYQKFNELLKKI